MRASQALVSALGGLVSPIYAHAMSRCHDMLVWLHHLPTLNDPALPCGALGTPFHTSAVSLSCH